MNSSVTMDAAPVAAPQWPLSSEDVKLIAELGFMACNARHVKAAQAIFKGLRELRPDRAFPYIGLAMLSMNVGRPEDAARLLRDVALPLNPDDEELMLFLAMALRSARRSTESSQTLQKLLDRPGEETAVRKLARTLVRDPQAATGTLLESRTQTSTSNSPLNGGWSVPVGG